MGSRHRPPKIVHQILDAATAGQTLAKERFFKHPMQSSERPSRSTESILIEQKPFL